MAYIPEIKRITTFDENVTAQRVPLLSFKPTWGVSKLNYDIIEVSGGLATGSLSGSGYQGTIQLSTGNNTSGSASIRTKLLGEYQAGNQAECGWGVIIPNNPTGNQLAEWGYYTEKETSGFGWGLDSISPYIFYIVDGSKNIVRQSNWNKNTLSGSLNFSDGIITQTEFTWYGFGNIKFYVQDRANTEQTIRTLVHTTTITGSTSMIDPNQPLRFKVDNNGTASNFNMHVAGHQFSIIAGDKNPRKRIVSAFLDRTELINTGSWQPVIAVRRKQNFKGKENSIQAVVRSFTGNGTTDMTFKLVTALSGSIVNGTWINANGWGDESAVEIKLTSATTRLTASNQGYSALYRFVDAGNKTSSPAILQSNEQIVLGNSSEAILFVKMDTPAANEFVKATLEWEEEW